MINEVANISIALRAIQNESILAAIKEHFLTYRGRLNERLVARAKEIVLLGTGMGAARLTVLDDVDIGDDSDSLQQVCITALGKNWY